MKKFLALFITFLYICTSSICYAVNGLYYLKNTNKNTVTNYIKTTLEAQNYTIQKTNPIYAISNKNPENYAYISLENYGSSILYYYETNNDKKINKSILKTFDMANIIYEQSYNEVSINRLAEIAQMSITNQTPTYNFEEPKQTYQQPVMQKQGVNSTSLKGFVGKVGKGAVLNVYLQNPINTATATVGDQVIAVLKDHWTINNSVVIADKGSVLYGNLTKANAARIGLRNGYVQINFNRLDTPDGQTYNLMTEPIDFEVTDDGRLKSTITNVAATAAVGALVGLAFALLGNGNYGSAAAIGAGAAGGIALATQVAQRGIDAEIPSYTEMEVVLDSDVSVIIY